MNPFKKNHNLLKTEGLAPVGSGPTLRGRAASFLMGPSLVLKGNRGLKMKLIAFLSQLIPAVLLALGTSPIMAIERATINIGTPITNPYPEPSITPPLKPESRPITSTVFPAVTVQPKTEQKKISVRRYSNRRHPSSRAISPPPSDLAH